MKARVIWLVGVAFTLAAGGARACGACVEDSVAATYDYAVVTDAAASRKVVVFLQVGRGTALAEDEASRLAHAAAALPGIVAGSVRASVWPAALSFALDAARSTPAQALARLRRAAPGFELRTVKTIGPASASRPVQTRDRVPGGFGGATR